MRRRRTLGFLGLLAALTITAGAAAEHDTIRLVSAGTADIPASSGSFSFSDDGSRALFTTAEAVLPEDTDGAVDVYANDGGTISLLSGGDEALDARLVDMTDDGRRVFFDTVESLDDADTDAGRDLYEASGGEITFLSGGSSNLGVDYRRPSADGSRVTFETMESLTPADGDSALDVYASDGGTITLLTPGTTADASFRHLSADGSRMIFITFESLDSADTDSDFDLYRSSSGDITLLTPGTSSTVRFAFASADGERVLVDANNALAPGDDDGLVSDLYEVADGEYTLRSGSGSGAFSPSVRNGLADLSRIYFQTNEPLDAADTDTATDLYEDSDGEVRLLTPGTASINARYAGHAADGSRVFFTAAESLDPADFDTHADVYETIAGTLTLRTPGTGGVDVAFGGVSTDGNRVFFDTVQPLVGDGDSARDVYESTGGATSDISLVTPGTATGIVRYFVSPDGARVYFESLDSLVSTDEDTVQDVYEASISADAGAPVVTIAIDSADAVAATGWYNRASSGQDGVRVNVSATDDTAVENITCRDGSTQVLDASSSSGSFVLGDGRHSVSCTASDGVNPPGAGAGSTPMPLLLDVDQTPPALSCVVAAPGPVFLLRGAGGPVSATATDATSGPSSATASAGADTTSVGSKTASLTASDTAGNSATAGCPYLVKYRFLGFSSPKAGSRHGAGSSINVRFRLGEASGLRLSDSEARTLVTPVCRVGVTLDGVRQPGCASYDREDNRFEYRLRTSRNLPLGTHTIGIEVTAQDGSVVNDDSVVVTIRRGGDDD
jgi:hypothetical protein